MFANAYKAAAGTDIDPAEFNLAKTPDGKRRLNISTWNGVGLFMAITQHSDDVFEVTPAEPNADHHPWAVTYATVAELADSAGAQVIQ